MMYNTAYKEFYKALQALPLPSSSQDLYPIHSTPVIWKARKISALIPTWEKPNRENKNEGTKRQGYNCGNKESAKKKLVLLKRTIW